MQSQRFGDGAAPQHAPPDAAAHSRQESAAIAAAGRFPDAEAFILADLRLQPVALIPGISLYTAHPASRLSRLGLQAPPYWAHAWAGGAALARHLFNHPETAAGRTVLDLGAGSGLAAIAAAIAGAASVTAVEADPWGVAAARLNANANGVAIQVRTTRAESLATADADLVLAGDVFYSEEAAREMLPCLERCRAGGAEVLVGDPGRLWLPNDQLELIATHAVRDFGDTPGTTRPGYVFRLHLQGVTKGEGSAKRSC